MDCYLPKRDHPGGVATITLNFIPGPCFLTGRTHQKTDGLSSRNSIAEQVSPLTGKGECLLDDFLICHAPS